MKEPWTRDEASAAGQVFEDRLWALLMEQSRGHLHVFRPLLDRGVDGLLHRLSDGAYFPVQAKGRSSLRKGRVQLLVAADSVTDDHVVIVAGEVVEGGVGPSMLVIPTPDFRHHALLTTADGLPVYSMSFSMQPRSKGRWAPWLAPSDRLVERFGVPLGLPALAIAPEPEPLRRGPLGFLGETEIARVLAQAERLNLFRPFPDLETVELAVRHLDTGRVLGFQIKTVSVDRASPNRPVDIRIASFRPAPTTYFTVVAWMPDQRRFHDECLVFPSEDLLQFARRAGPHYMFEFQPGSKRQRRLDRYRRPVATLAAETEGLLSDP